MIEPQKYLFCFLNPKDLDNQLVQEGRKEGRKVFLVGIFYYVKFDVCLIVSPLNPTL